MVRLPIKRHERRTGLTGPTGQHHKRQTGPTGPTGQRHERPTGPTGPTGQCHKRQTSPTGPTGPRHERQTGPTGPTGQRHVAGDISHNKDVVKVISVGSKLGDELRLFGHASTLFFLSHIFPNPAAVSGENGGR